MNIETVTVVDWVANDRPVYEKLRAILKQEDGYSGRRACAKWINSPDMAAVPAPVAAMADFIEHLVRWDDGSTYRNLYRVAKQGGFESWIPSQIRVTLGPFVWYDISLGVKVRDDVVDWLAVRDVLLRADTG